MSLLDRDDRLTQYHAPHKEYDTSTPHSVDPRYKEDRQHPCHSTIDLGRVNIDVVLHAMGRTILCQVVKAFAPKSTSQIYTVIFTGIGRTS